MTTPLLENREQCTRCGCCVSVCPVGCVYIDRYPVKGDGCISCGLCTTVCPAEGINLKKTAEELFKNSNYHEHMGRFKATYTGYAQDPTIREKATSGGVVTSLLLCLLEQHIIDSALVVSFSSPPWKTTYEIATCKEEIIKSAQTKYQVTPLCVPLKDLECKRIAVVGPPCVIQGLRRIQKYSEVGEKIKILIGLFCWVNMEREATEFLLKKLGIALDEVESIEYRSGDHLGGFKVQLKNGDTTFLGKECYNTLPLLFAPQPCVYCPDFSNELADISVGDAKFVQSKEGHTFIIVRSEQGEKILKTCADNRYITVEKSDMEEIVLSERSALLFKKGAYKRMQKMEYTGVIPLRNRLFEFLFMGVHRNRKFFKFLFEVMPLSFFKVVSKLITRERS